MAEEGFKRKLAAILSADVEGYSRLMDDDEEATVRTLTSPRNAITDLVQKFRGRVVCTTGDNILTKFSSAVGTAGCAVEVQENSSLETLICLITAGWNFGSVSTWGT